MTFQMRNPNSPEQKVEDSIGCRYNALDRLAVGRVGNRLNLTLAASLPLLGFF
jgi:hypothetical protein